jgi:hypothetical protein
LQAPALAAAWVIAVFSALRHKEFRFLHPLLPIIHSYAGAAMHRIGAIGCQANKVKNTLAEQFVTAIQGVVTAASLTFSRPS